MIKNLYITNYRPEKAAAEQYSNIFKESKDAVVTVPNSMKTLSQYQSDSNIPDNVLYSTHHQNVGIFTKLSDNSVFRDVKFQNISIYCIIPGPEYKQQLVAGIIAGQASVVQIISVQLISCYIHLAANINLRYVGGFIGRA